MIAPIAGQMPEPNKTPCVEFLQPHADIGARKTECAGNLLGIERLLRKIEQRIDLPHCAMMPQRLPISPKWRTNVRMRGERSMKRAVFVISVFTEISDARADLVEAECSTLHPSCGHIVSMGRSEASVSTGTSFCRSKMLELKCAPYRHEYNHEQPHRSIDHKTPIEFLKSIGIPVITLGISYALARLR